MDKRIVVVSIVHSRYYSSCRNCVRFLENKDIIEVFLTNKGYRSVFIEYETKSDSHFDFLDINDINFPRCLYGKIGWSPFIFAVTEKDFFSMENGSPLPERILLFNGIRDGEIIKHKRSYKLEEWVKTLYKLIEIRQPVQYLRKRSITGKG